MSRKYYGAISTVEFQEAVNILTGSAKCQGINGYCCDNVVYPEMSCNCYHDSHLRTTSLIDLGGNM